MADYKRMVSYMYQYENGVKRKNVGFARIEAKNSQCKITLHMQLLGQLDSIFPTYLIQRDGNNMELIYLGDAVLKNQVMDSKLSANEDNIMDSGYRLSDMGGLLLFLNDYIFFATEWDDKEIDSKEVLEALKPKEKRNLRDTVMLPETEGELEAPAKAAELIEEEITPLQESAIPKYKLPRGWKTIERMQNPHTEVVNKPIAASLESADIDLRRFFNVDEPVYPEKAPELEMPELQMPILEKPMLEMPILEKPELQMPELEMPEIEEPEFQIPEFEMPELETPGFLLPEDNREFTDKEEDDDHNGSEEYGDEENYDSGRGRGEGEEEQADHPAAQNVFDHYPRIYPFEDNEIILCVKIEPKDIGLLPKEQWTLSNNSFLMHGFYCYHHLIFAKMKDRYGCRYILGIPGIYHNRERFMARMFGFESFKSIRKRELRQGDFGYWYLPVSF